MTRVFAHLADLREQVGQVVGVSDWVRVDQARIDRFAQATDDHQWIHTDPARAAAGPFHGTVAHGFLTLSLVAGLFDSAFTIADSGMGLNYGLNRVRFPAPVPVNSRLRAHFRLLEWAPLDGVDGARLTVEITVEREGSAKPVCVAESVTHRFVGPAPG
jgi:acyl dehydratase